MTRRQIATLAIVAPIFLGLAAGGPTIPPPSKPDTQESALAGEFAARPDVLPPPIRPSPQETDLAGDVAEASGEPPTPRKKKTGTQRARLPDTNPRPRGSGGQRAHGGTEPKTSTPDTQRARMPDTGPDPDRETDTQR